VKGGPCDRESEKGLRGGEGENRCGSVTCDMGERDRKIRA